MIGNSVKQLILENEADFLIPDEKVAHVMDINPLNHAFLVLANVRYSKIPVLNKQGQFVGLIGLSDIVNAMFDVTSINADKLNDYYVKDFMETGVKTIQRPYDIEYLLHLMVDSAFVPVTNQDNYLEGIVTRREILKAVNHMAHSLESQYDVEKKELKEISRHYFG